MKAAIRSVEYHLPQAEVTTESLSEQFPEWSVAKIDEKTGIRTRHIASPEECSSDLAYQAACKLFDGGSISAADVDYILLCTQSPDYFLPTTACLLQHRLGIPTTAGALDFNLGCSGFVYGLGMAQGLIETGQARNVILLTAETYSKFLHPRDRSVRTIFGDAAAATLVSAVESDNACLGPFVYGTDGAGGNNLIVPAGAMRLPRSEQTAVTAVDDSGNERSQDHLFMNGAEVFNFTLSAVPKSITRLLDRAGKTPDDIDHYIFHQANRYMLEHLRKRIKIPEEKFVVSMAHCGNTVSSTIPIALKHAVEGGTIQKGATLMLVGFGVGYSWGAALARWV